MPLVLPDHLLETLFIAREDNYPFFVRETLRVDQLKHTVGRYEIQHKLGEGGMAAVYLAYDPFVKRQVAIKVLPRQFTSDARFRTRFQREAEVIAGLEHPSIVPIYDFGEYDDQPFIVMRYMMGGSLWDRLEEGPLPLDSVLQVLQRVSSALDEAHAQGIVHRDLKPGNILFDHHDLAFLSDFGIAKLTEATTSLTGGGMLGTPSYMSPEQIEVRGEIGPHSDVYALGVVLFEMLSGERPYQADTPVQVIMMHLNEPVPLISQRNPALPREFDNLLAWAMAKDPAERCPSAGQLAQAASALSRATATPVTMPHFPRHSGSGTGAGRDTEGVQQPVAAAPPLSTRRRGRVALWLGASALVAIVLAAGGWIASRALRQQAPRETPTAPSEVGEAAFPTAAPAHTPTDAPTPTETLAPTRAPTSTQPPPAAVTSNSQWEPVIRRFEDANMALVPPGCFMMGNTNNVFAVPVVQYCFEAPFWIDVYEVRNVQYYGSYLGQSLDTYPAANLTWGSAREWCENRGMRLPTEAEWEYAGRGPNNWLYPWGDTWDPQRATFAANSDGRSSPVDSQPDGISWVGAYHMVGNVREWTSTIYMPYPYDPEDGRENQEDASAVRVVRGSGFRQGGFVLHTREEGERGYSDDSLGFRCARDY